MILAVLNFSGNVGKSTISRHLLSPRMNEAKIFAIETINSDGGGEGTKGKQFVDTQIRINLEDSAVVDIGSSNVEDVIKVLAQNPGAHEDFDFFVIPVTPSAKQQRDTISTIEALADLGVPAKKIRILFNQVELGDDPRNVFSGLFEYQKEEKKFTIKEDAVIHLNPLYPKLAGSSAGINQIIADTTDYKTLGKGATDPGEKLRCAQMLALQRGAAGVISELDSVFKSLFK